jgi:hypothetical protein
MWRGHLQEGCAAVKAQPDTPVFDTSLIFLTIAFEVVFQKLGTTPSPLAGTVQQYQIRTYREHICSRQGDAR